MNSLQPEIEAKGLEIFSRMEGEKPVVFSPRNLTGRLLDWSMRNEAVKVQMFRFVDALASLHSAREIAQHAYEYLGNTNGGLPGPVRWTIHHAAQMPWIIAWAARQSVQQMAKTFILAPHARKAIPALQRLRLNGLTFTVDILGETAVSEVEAAQYQRRYLELSGALAEAAEHWSPIAKLDQDSHGELPRVNVSIKLSALYSQIDPTDPEGAIQQLSARLRPLLAEAKELNVFLNFDMEHYGLKDLTLELFKRLLSEPAFKDYRFAGLALQAYLKDAEQDLESLIQWANTRGVPMTIRLIKGAYWDYETVKARQRGWPVPVFEHKAETDANYEKLARRMMKNEALIRCAFGTHSVRSIAACMVLAEQVGLPKQNLEFQMLYGMAEPIKRSLIKMGYRLRDYCPIGEILPGMSYLVRRLLENTSNEGFLRATFAEHAEARELLQDPGEVSARTQRAKVRKDGDKLSPLQLEPVFHNEPHSDFTRRVHREAMLQALGKVRSELGRKCPLVLGGREVWTEKETISINPARPSEVIGRVAKGSKAEADLALAEAQAAFPKWSRTPVPERARILKRAAAIMYQEKFELAALEVFEVGKNWAESDADVAEAIDFCNFYADEMERIAASHYNVPGEANLHHYIPRGLGIIIAPWNFPLAILCGMTSAAVAAGNCVMMKPSEQSPVIAARFMDVLQRAGLPPGVVNFLPGSGAEIGSYLVSHPQIAFIAFTGSREVGLKIYEATGQTHPGQPQLKKVVCEMGGKNAVIVDSDADLDEAVPGITSSAFGYAGQKCSALSRLIVLGENAGRLLERLIEASRSLRVGLPEEPGTALGPVIDKDSYQRILGYIELGKKEAQLVFQGEVPKSEGYFIPPTIFNRVPPHSRLAKEEIFGPVLSVLEAKDLDEALAIANDTQYGLTGGFYSRSPAHIERVKAEFQVGNLYINRGITGALAARQPFGGFKMSGGGTKAGGRDYLQNFLFPRCVTENLMRRGFAPEEGATEP